MKPLSKKWITGLLLIALAHGADTAHLQEMVSVFTDVTSGSPHYEAISYLHQNGIVEGYPDNSFRPKRKVNRAEALKMILLGSDILVPEFQEQEVFPDVLADAWYAKYALKAKHLNIVQGDDGTGLFRPGDTVNLAEVLKIILRTNEISPDDVRNDPYPDVPREAWFAPYFAYAKSHRLLDSPENAHAQPALPVDRGLLAELMYRLKVEPAATVDTYASFYGNSFHGRGTASGETFNQNDYTAAHKTYPFGTYLKVTNAENGKSVVVRVNDRGPYAGKNRVIDLSKAAFQQIASLGRGVIAVTIEEVPEEDHPVRVEELEPSLLQADLLKGNPYCPESQKITTIDTGAFEGVTLGERLPQKILENELLSIRGQVPVGTKRVNLFLVDNQDNQTVYGDDVEEGQFEISVRFPKSGDFRIGMILSDKGESLIETIEVLPSACLQETMDETLPPPSLAQIDLNRGDTVITWNGGDYPLFKVSLKQGEKIKSYLIRGAAEWVPPYRDFKDFKEGEVELLIRGAKLEEQAILKAPGINWSPPLVKRFIGTRHFEYILDETKIDLLTLSTAAAVRNELEATVRPKTDLRAEAALIAPEGPVRKIALSAGGLQPVKNSKEIDFFKSGSYSLAFTYHVTDIGTHFMEINDLAGIAALNVPVYAKNRFPLLPDQNDLADRELQSLGSDMNVIRQAMAALINRERTERNQKSLTLENSLNKLAQARVDSMIQNNYFGHWDSKGVGAEELKISHGVRTVIGENLAQDANMELAHYGLMRSAIHRNNILGEDWTRVGIGAGVTKDGSHLFVQIFGAEPINTADLAPLRKRLRQAIDEKRETPFAVGDHLIPVAQAWSDLMASQNFFGWDDGQGDALLNRVREAEPKKAIGTFIVANSRFDKAVEQIVENLQIRAKKWNYLAIGIAQDEVGIIKVTLIYTE